MAGLLRLLPRLALALLGGRAAGLRTAVPAREPAASGRPDALELFETSSRSRRVDEALQLEAAAGPSSDVVTADLRRQIVEEMHSRYAHAPPEERWDELLDRALAEPADPCDADVLTSFGWNGGWGSGFNALSSEVAVAAYFGRTVAVCVPEGKDISMWTVLRGPLRLCARPELCEGDKQYDSPEEPRQSHMPWGYSVIFWGGCLDHDQCDVTLTHMPKVRPARRYPGISPSFRNFSKRFRHRVYERIYHFENKTEAVVAKVQRALLPGELQPYVGVHIRGTDKFREAVDVGIRPYVKNALRLTNLTGARAVYLASDDFNRSLAFKERYEAEAPPGVAVHLKPRDGYPPVAGGWNVFGEQRIVLMAEVKLMVEAAAFVGTASSNLGRLVYFLRPQRDGGAESDLLDVSVDEDNDFFSRHC